VTKIDCGKSSWLKSMRYFPAPEDMRHLFAAHDPPLHGVLVVESQTGSRYAYGIPSWVVGLLSAAKSKGGAFGKLIRGRYPSIRLGVDAMFQLGWKEEL
jgi:hypothetical protein